MAVTRLERKEQKLKVRSSKRRQRLKHLNKKPTIKNIDVEKIKAEFEKKAKSSPAAKAEAPAETSPKEKKASEPKTEAAVAEKQEAKKAEEPKESAPKAEAKEEKAASEEKDAEEKEK